jgi:arginine N-succinyltransferase
MIIVRAAGLDDTEQLWELIGQATYGMTTLQITKEQLTERIELSHFAFHRKTERPGSDLYVFVMEDLASKRLVGTSCIFSKIGGYEPFYSYRRVIEQSSCELLGVTRHMESLQLQKVHDGPTEIGSLFVLPEYRGLGRGRLLSLARFVFMARHPKRFAGEVIAEMRGVVNDDGSSPFWEAIGKKFFGMEFPEADSLSTIDKRFIEELMPRHPIYVCLLPQTAQDVLSQVHRQTEPALAMLCAEGFAISDQVDIFDGGPVVSCRREAIGAVQRTREVVLDQIVEDPREVQLAEVIDRPREREVIIASLQGGFRATLGCVRGEGREVAVARPVAEALQVQPGERLWVLDPHPAPPGLMS